MDDRVGKKFPVNPKPAQNPNPGRVADTGKLPSTSRKGGSMNPSTPSKPKKGY